MRCLVTGAYGFIGRHIVQALREQDLEVVGAGRDLSLGRRLIPDIDWMACDFNRDVTPDAWVPRLEGIDAVVNCVGAFQQGLREDLQALQTDAPAALFAACERLGVRRVVHVSAVGADEDAPTDFMRTKATADADLKTRDLDWVILRPGVVTAHAVYGGTALFRGLAGVPLLTPLVQADARVQLVAMEDVAATAVWAVQAGAPAQLSLDLVHPSQRSIAEVIAAYRHWLGFRPQPTIAVPRFVATPMALVADALGWLGWRSPVRSTGLAQLAAGMRGDPATWIRSTGIEPLGLERSLARHPATVQDRWFARLYFLRPAAIALLALFWVWTGAVSLGPGWEQAMAGMGGAGLPPAMAPLVIVATAALDIALGLALLLEPLARRVLLAMVAVSLSYLLGGIALAPYLLIDPLGALVKTIFVTATALFTLATLDSR